MLSKRNVRLRKDYLFQKSKEAREQVRYEKKLKLHDALENEKKLPEDVRKQAPQLRKEFFYDDGLERPKSTMDSEYARAGEIPPRILITTSRDPSTRLQQFAKEIRLNIPNSQRINRGAYVLRELADACRTSDVTDLIVLHEHRGIPDAMIVSHFPHGPTAFFTLHNVVLRHDIEDKGTMSEAFPHLVFDGFNLEGSRVGRRIVQILKHLFPIPKTDSKRVLTFANRGDYISFRHHVFQECAPGASLTSDGVVAKEPVAIAEVGPRFEMRPFKIVQGTLEVREADVEWMLRPYQRTAHKRDVL